jgi:hypothetical protein
VHLCLTKTATFVADPAFQSSSIYTKIEKLPKQAKANCHVHHTEKQQNGRP